MCNSRITRSRALTQQCFAESSRMHTAGSSRQDCGGSRPDSEGSGRGGSRGTAASRDSVGMFASPNSRARVDCSELFRAFPCCFASLCVLLPTPRDVSYRSQTIDSFGCTKNSGRRYLGPHRRYIRIMMMCVCTHLHAGRKFCAAAFG